MSVTVLQLHKRASYEFKYIQDKYAISPDRNVFALADGTTQSFNSEIWAEVITSSFAQNPKFIPDEIVRLFKQNAEQYKASKFEFSSNPAKASLEKAKQKNGGTATFIGLRFINNTEVEIISCGDSNFFLSSSNHSTTAYPFPDLDSLDENKNFLNTELLVQDKVENAFFNVKSFQYKTGDVLILATDALSRLMLNNPSVLNELLGIETFEQLLAFCLKYWDSKELQEDDISAIILKIDDKNGKTIVIPPENFSFPREKEEEFIPTSLIQDDNEPNLTNMQMNEIRTQFNGIANDFRQVKKKQAFHELLLMLAVSLILISISYSLFFQKNSNTETSDQIIRLEKTNREKDSIIQDQQEEIRSLNRRLQKDNIVESKREPPKNDTQAANIRLKTTSIPKKEPGLLRQAGKNTKDSTTDKRP